jgi:hypothetical protein
LKLPRDGHLQEQGFGEAAFQDYSVGQFLLFLCLQRVNNYSDNFEVTGLNKSCDHKEGARISFIQS